MNNKNIAVKCSTIEQKTEVVKYARKGKDLYDVARAEECINLETGCNGTEKWYREEKFFIISYEEFERNYLKKEDSPIIISELVIEGNVYVTNYVGQGDYIFLARGNNKNVPYLRPSDNTFLKAGNISRDNGFKEYRSATPEEKLWLETCIKASKFIPYEKVIKHKSMTYEVGKWYKGWKNGHKYAKFHHLKSNDIREYFYWTDAVFEDGHTTLNGNGSNNWANEPDLVEASLEEIQQYLPKGYSDKFPDKVFKFEVGKWYEFRPTWTNEKQLGKFEKDAGSLYFKPWITNSRTYSKSGGSFNHDVMKEIKEIDVSIVQKFLPEGHPDKTPVLLTPEEGKWYKVKLKNGYTKGSWLFKSLKKQGDARITYASKSVYLEDGDKFGNNAVADDNNILSLEPADMEEVYKHFPEERLIETYSDYYKCIKKYLEQGEVVGRIYKHVGSQVFEYGDLKGKKFSCTKSPQDILEYLIPSTKEEYEAQFKSEEKSEIMKFKIGDVIKFKTETYYIPSFESGSSHIPQEWIKHGNTWFKENKGKIEHVHNEYYIISYIDDNGKTVQLGFKEDVIELLPLEKPIELKVGMYLKALVDGPNGCPASVKMGEVGKIRQVESNISGSVNFPRFNCYSFTFESKKYELMPEGWTPEIDKGWIPQVGEYAVMEAAGGWGYKPDNNGCIAIIEEVKPYSAIKPSVPERTYSISGTVLNPKVGGEYIQFTHIPIKTDKGYICRKALAHEIPEAAIPEEIKIGDWVICIGESATAPGKPQSCGWKKGLVFIVTSITDGGSILWGGDRGNGMFNVPGHIRKALPEEIPVAGKFNIGDWVVVLDEFENEDSTGKKHFTKGEVFKISSTQESGVLHSKLWLHKNSSAYMGAGGCRKALPHEIPVSVVPPKEEIKKNEDWCVKRTPENTAAIIEYFQRVRKESYRGNGTYYGMRGKYPFCAHISWGKLITTEEFYKLAEVSKEPMYVTVVDPYDNTVAEQQWKEVEEKRVLINLIQPKKGGILDTKVNSTHSVAEMLVKPKKVVLF